MVFSVRRVSFSSLGGKREYMSEVLSNLKESIFILKRICLQIKVLMLSTEIFYNNKPQLYKSTSGVHQVW